MWKACFGVLIRHSVVQGLNVTVATRQHLIPAGLWDLGALQAHFKGPPQQDVRPQLSASSIVLFPMLLTSTASSSCGFTTSLEHLEVWKIAYQGKCRSHNLAARSVEKRPRSNPQYQTMCPRSTRGTEPSMDAFEVSVFVGLGRSLPAHKAGWLKLQHGLERSQPQMMSLDSLGGSGIAYGSLCIT